MPICVNLAHSLKLNSTDPYSQLFGNGYKNLVFPLCSIECHSLLPPQIIPNSRLYEVSFLVSFFLMYAYFHSMDLYILWIAQHSCHSFSICMMFISCAHLNLFIFAWRSFCALNQSYSFDNYLFLHFKLGPFSSIFRAQVEEVCQR